MKYYIGYPITFHCNLRCEYCFHSEFHKFVDEGVGQNHWREKTTFTFEDYRRWRNKHLSDGTDFIMTLFGGEPFCKQNVENVFKIIETSDKERIDILSNGVCDNSIIQRLEKYKNKFHRIGFTFHRETLSGKDKLKEIFESNVMTVKSMGIPLYVKELMIVKHRDAIVENKRYWLSKGVEFKIQDFKGRVQGWSNEEYKKYTPIDNLLISQEYKHGDICSCIKGYKNLFIRGYDMADVWEKGADVIACWYDPTVIGNILEDWYSPNYIITRKRSGEVDVKNVKKIYRGTYEKDLPNIKGLDTKSF